MKLNRKKLLIGGGAAVLAAAIGMGALALAGKGGKDPIYVYDFSIVGMTDYWGDRQSSQGLVKSDNIQTIYLTETQTVTKVAVQQGDTVKKGDLLMSFDSTLSDLAVEKKRLAVEQLKLELEEAQARLMEIRNMAPMQPYTGGSTGPVDYGTPITALKYDFASDNPDAAAFDGGTADTPLICWLTDKSIVNHDLLDELLVYSNYLQEKNFLKRQEEAEKEEAEKEETEEGEDGSEEAPDPGEKEEYIPKSAFYVVFKVTSGNLTRGESVIWQGAYVDTTDHSFRLYDASGVWDITGQSPIYPEPETPDYGSGYTLEQLVQMREDQSKTILDIKYKIKVAEAEYSIAQREMIDGNIYADVDGVVVSLLTEEEARQRNQPFMKVSGGGGFYVEGNVNELIKDQLVPGTEVNIMDYRSGMSYTGTVERVGDFPISGDNFWGPGNPNASFYPFTVFVDETADLTPNNYVSMEFSMNSQQGGIYLQNPFLRSEGSESYVYLRGAGGKLEKRTVTTGKSLWGSYTEILSGLTVEDKVAFPYGKNVKPGAATADGDYSTLNN